MSVQASLIRIFDAPMVVYTNRSARQPGFMPVSGDDGLKAPHVTPGGAGAMIRTTRPVPS